MKRIPVYGSLLLLFISLCPMAYSQVDVLMQHTDLARTGWNKQETILNHSNVGPGSFGLLFTLPVDDQIFAQPLVATQVTIPSAGTKNVVYVCTVNNSVYAFDADNGTLYWRINFTPAGYRVANAGDVHSGLCGGPYSDFTGNYGIVGTPVIDKTSGTLYFVSKVVDTAGITIDNHTYDASNPTEEYTYTTTGFHQYLHAIDLGSGSEKFNSGNPVEIVASSPGTGDGNVNDTIAFDPRRQFNRTGLVLSGGIVYIAFAAHCDWNPSHGWLLGYDASSLQRKIVYNATPNDGRGGIWMSGAAPAVDAAGNLYFATGNGNAGGTIPSTDTSYADLPADTVNRGESIVKVTPNAPDNTATGVSVSSFFTPFDYKFKNENDMDFPVQVMLIPNSNTVLAGCKDENLYLMNQTNLGGFNAASNNVLQTVPVTSDPNAGAEMHSSFAYFGGSDVQYVYQLAENTNLEAFPINSSHLLGTPIVVVDTPIAKWPKFNSGAGGFMAVSSNGSDTSTGILWLSSSNGKDSCDGSAPGCPGVLRAIKANNINTELWNSNMYAADYLGFFQKMNCPTVANGMVYQATGGKQVAAYGTLSSERCATNAALYQQAFASSGTPSHAFDGDPSTAWASNPSDPQHVYVDLGQTYNICTITVSWATALGKNFTIDVSSDAATWTTAQTFTGNTSFYNQVTGNFQGRYVRMNGTQRGVSFLDYAVNEMQVWGTPSIALALNQLTLTANNINNDYVQLKWSASGDIPTNYFEVERSGVGNSFVQIMQVSAAGGSSGNENYSANDDNPINGINYYRVRQVDVNGNSHYSPIVAVNFGKRDAPVISPNPANSYFYVIAGSEPVKEITVYDASGKLLQQIVNESGSRNTIVSTANLSIGVYIVEIKTATQVYQQKVLKQ